jgi:hypothetical protein
MSGWYLMHRGWMQSPDFLPEPFTEREAFLWSIEQAAHGPHLQWFNRHQVPVERGEFVTSIRKMASAFGWGDKRVRGFTARMVKCGKWAQRGAHPNSILTVCNYEQFQSPQKVKGTAEGRPRAHSGHTQGTQQKEGLNNGDEGQRIEKASPPRSPAQPIADALAAWSQIAAVKGWSPVSPTVPLNDKRRKGLSRVLGTYGLDGWIAGLQRAADSQMLGGPDPPAWFNLSFVCSLDNFTKLHEGNYDRSFSHKPAGQSPWLAARDQLRGPSEPPSVPPRALSGPM